MVGLIPPAKEIPQVLCDICSWSHQSTPLFSRGWLVDRALRLPLGVWQYKYFNEVIILFKRNCFPDAFNLNSNTMHAGVQFCSNRFFFFLLYVFLCDKLEVTVLQQSSVLRINIIIILKAYMSLALNTENQLQTQFVVQRKSKHIFGYT